MTSARRRHAEREGERPCRTRESLGRRELAAEEQAPFVVGNHEPPPGPHAARESRRERCRRRGHGTDADRDPEAAAAAALAAGPGPLHVSHQAELGAEECARLGQVAARAGGNLVDSQARELPKRLQAALARLGQPRRGLRTHAGKLSKGSGGCVVPASARGERLVQPHRRAEGSAEPSRLGVLDHRAQDAAALLLHQYPRVVEALEGCAASAEL
mmetsp:Transcript_49316/g.161257  ORF Transcript_49316/g.161257 Transcript_49316/m.161257 type:complete len:215 (+) Transcript_49316:146-790(+)